MYQQEAKQVKLHNDGDWMPYRRCLLVAAFVVLLMLTRPLLKFVSLYIGSNYLCTNLDGLAQNGSHLFSKLLI